MPEDRAIALNKSDVDPCTHGQDIDPTKKMWTDRQTDRRMTFQLYTYRILFECKTKWLCNTLYNTAIVLLEVFVHMQQDFVRLACNLIARSR